MSYDNLYDLCKLIESKLPTEWDTEMDELHIKKTEERECGFRRDDLCAFIIDVGDGEWPPESVYLYIPNSVKNIPDRPGQKVVEVEELDVDKIVSKIVEELPEYKGTFEYED